MTGATSIRCLREGYRAGRLPKPPLLMPRCWNKVRYEVMDHLGYFCTESSEHFAEYVPWFIKDGREDLIEEFRIPLDEYPLRCVEQAEGWAEQAKGLKAAAGIEVKKSHEFAAEMMNAIVTTRLMSLMRICRTGASCRNCRSARRWRCRPW
jgi:alpha-galactosidase